MNNNFDYTSVPIELLYEDKKHLTDFGVEDSSLLNCLIQKKLYERFAQYTNYESYATLLFNRAYYICTVALVDNHPEWRFGTFMRETAFQMHQDNESVGMVFAIVMLQMWARRWDMHDHPIATLFQRIESELRDEQKYQDIFKEVFWQITQDLQAKGINNIEYKDEFLPRPINYKLLNNHWNDIKALLVCDDPSEETLLEFITAMGKDEKEQKVISKFLRDHLHYAFTHALVHESFFDGIDRKIHDLNHPEEKAQEEAEFEANMEQEALEEIENQWNKERVIEQEAKIAQLEARIKQLEGSTKYASNDDIDEIFPSKEKQQEGVEQSINPEQEQTIKTLQEEVERLRSDIEAYRNQGKGLTSSEAAVFLTALCHHHKQIPQNGRENLAPLITKIWGFTDTTSRAALRSKITQERADKVAKHIKSWAPAIANIISQLPPLLEQENKERLIAQNPKKK